MKPFKTTCMSALLAALLAAFTGGAFAQGNAATTQNPDASSGKSQNDPSTYTYGQSPEASKMDPSGSLPPNTTSEATRTPGSDMNRAQDNSSGASTSAGSSDQSESTRQSGSAAQAGSSGEGAAAKQNESSGQSGSAGKQASGGAQQSDAPTVFMMVPVQVASQDNAMKQGCWAKVYARENFGGDSLTLVGPVNVPDMDTNGPYGMDWDDKVNSIELGPNARMSVYDNENYRDRVAEFKPGQRIGDISKRTGLFDEFASVKLDCQKA